MMALPQMLRGWGWALCLGALIGSTSSCKSGQDAAKEGAEEQVGQAQSALSVPTVHSDLRLASADTLRRAALRLANACRAQNPEHMSIPATSVVQTAALAAVLPDALASQLACAIDLPLGTSCQDLLTCAQGNSAAFKGEPTCVGNDLESRSKSGAFAQIHCADFGDSCFDTDLGGICGRGLCAAGETYACDGTGAVSACIQGVRVRSLCGHGLVCGQRADHLLDCVGSGAACSGDGRCSGTKAINCKKESGAPGHEATVECADFGMTCAIVPPTQQAICVPNPTGCDIDTAASCIANDLNLCVAGAMWRVPCSQISLAGKCTAGAGAQGEAACL
jgi:hypothetical protein